MFDNIQNELNSGIKKIAEKSLLKKLNENGVTRNDLTDEKFNELLKLEIDIIKNDGKKVSAGIGIGVAISILSGGLF